VTATDDGGDTASAVAVVQVPPPVVIYPAWHATARQVFEELFAVSRHQSSCASIYLDTLESQSDSFYLEGLDHHQGLARTHLLSDGSVYFFLAHSEMGFEEHGNLMQFRYPGPFDGEHVQTTDPLVVAPLVQLLETTSQHPCDMAFLPEINGADAGYLFVAEQTPIWAGTHRASRRGRYLLARCLPMVCRRGFRIVGHRRARPAVRAPQLRVSRPLRRHLPARVVPQYHTDVVHVFTAATHDLFPQPVPGFMNLNAFQPLPEQPFAFPVDNRACQVHIVLDVTGQHFLLALRSDPPDDENADDYVDVHALTYSLDQTPPFEITSRLDPAIQLNFPPGDTSFASTGTAYVEASGRLLVASSYRWAEEGPGDNYVSRVDECPS
jgi:hypothetical protein